MQELLSHWQGNKPYEHFFQNSCDDWSNQTFSLSGHGTCWPRPKSSCKSCEYNSSRDTQEVFKPIKHGRMNFQALCPMLTNLLHNFSRNVKHPVLHYDIKITSKGGNAELNLAKVRDVIVSGPGSCRTSVRTRARLRARASLPIRWLSTSRAWASRSSVPWPGPPAGASDAA